MHPAPSLRQRASGVLLHPSSLPGPAGIGDLGAPAVRFAQALAESRQTWWQMLPVGPTGFGNPIFRPSCPGGFVLKCAPS